MSKGSLQINPFPKKPGSSRTNHHENGTVMLRYDIADTYEKR